MGRLPDYDVIMIWALHRLVRPTVELLRVMNECKAHGTVIVTENGPLDWFGPHGEFTTTMWAGLAQMDRHYLEQYVIAKLFQKLTPERVAAARAALAAQRAETPKVRETDARRAQLEQALAILEEDRRQGLYNSPTAAACFRRQYAELIEQRAQVS